MRKFTMKIASVCLAVSLGLSAVTGCSGGSASSGTASSSGQTGSAQQEGNLKDEIHIAMNAAPPSLDVQKTSAVVARQIAFGSIYESLMALKSDYSATPELCSSFDVNDKHTEYTYHLRKGVKFHNGQEMKADDVAASMNRWIESYGNAAAMVGKSRFEKVDDYTVKITLSAPALYLNELIAGAGQSAAVMPKSVIDAADPSTGLVKDYIGTGPYKFEKWAKDQYIELTAYGDYQPYGTDGQTDGWSGYKHAYIKDVYYDFVTDDSTRVSGIQSGQYDVAYKLPIDDYDMFKNNGDLKVYNEMSGSPGLIYNKKSGLGANKAMRQAVNAALNMEDIMKASYVNADFYRLDSSYMYKEQPTWYTDAGSSSYNQHNADKVKDLLKQAGYNGESFTILVSSDYTEFYNAAVVIKSELEAVGIKCNLLVSDWATFLTYRSDPSKYSAFITSFTPIVTPTMLLYMTSTWPGWETDPKIEEGLQKINGSTSTDEAVAAWKELQQYSWEDELPWSKFGDYYIYSAATTKVENLGYFQGPFIWNTKIYE